MNIVYLDQNHWIGLARAYSGKSNDNREVLDHAIKLTRAGTAIFPISFANNIELRKVKDAGRRRRLAEFFVFLSEGWFLAPQNLFIDAECYNAVIEVYGLSKEKIQINPVGRGIIFALGAYSLAKEDLGLAFEELRILEDQLDTPATLIEFLACPDETSSAILTSQLRSQDDRYSQEAERVRQMRLDQVPGELSDYRAMEVFLSIYTHILGAHFRQGISQEELLKGGRQRMLRLVSEVPSAYVDWKLGYQRDKQRTKKIDPHDLADLWHLNVAIPYCSHVLTERFWTNLVSRTDLQARFQTQVSAQLEAILQID